MNLTDDDLERIKDIIDNLHYLHGRGRYAEAIDDGNKALQDEKCAGSFGIRQEMALCCIGLAKASSDTAQKQALLDRSIVLLNEALAIAPKPFTQELLGETYAHMGRYDEALPIFTALSENHPKNGVPFVWIAKIHMATKNYPEAEATARKLLDFAETSHNPRLNKPREKAIGLKLLTQSLIIQEKWEEAFATATSYQKHADTHRMSEDFRIASALLKRAANHEVTPMDNFVISVFGNGTSPQSSQMGRSA
jgi:tetratricopeptide (TPR) repeat protein